MASRTSGGRAAFGGRDERIALPGAVVMLVLGVLITIAGCVGLANGGGDFVRSAGLAGGSGHLRVGTCSAHAQGRMVAYDCSGEVAPLSAAPRAGGGTVIMRDLSHDESGHPQQVSCTPTGTCVPAGTHAALGNALELCLALALAAAGLSLLLAALAGRRPHLLRTQGKRLARAARWGFGGLGALAVGLLIPYFAT